jgi:hypothetical protein
MTELDGILEDLQRSRSETLETIELLQVSRQKVEENERQLESPKAVLEYLDFFLDRFGGIATALEWLAAELPAGPKPEHLDSLRQIANNAAADQRRCVMFRDKWINRPLPFEQVRPLLNQISVDSRDQLMAYRSLLHAADRLQAGMGTDLKAADSDKLDRRALFTRWFGK